MELQARDAIKRRLLERDDRRDARAQVQGLLAEQALLLRPAALGGPGYGYGLPQQERETLEAKARALSMRVGSEWARLRVAALAALPDEQQRAMRGIDANLSALGARLHALNRANGGLDLR